jgi:hypothetical protein
MEWAKGYAEKYVEVKEGIAGILSYRWLLKVLNLSKTARAESDSTTTFVSTMEYSYKGYTGNVSECLNICTSWFGIIQVSSANIKLLFSFFICFLGMGEQGLYIF